MEDDSEGKSLGVVVVRVIQLLRGVVPDPVDGVLPRLHQHRVDVF